MAKDYPAEFDTQKDAEENKPVLLFEFLFDEGTEKYCSGRSDVTFPDPDGDVYTAKAIDLASVVMDAGGRVQKCTLKFDNINKNFSALVEAQPLVGRYVRVRRVYRDALGAVENHQEIFLGRMREPKVIGLRWGTVEATTGDLGTRYPLETYGLLCGHAFGDDGCNTDGNADITGAPLKQTGTADSGTTETLYDDARTEAEDFWKHGKLTVTKGSTTETRRVLSFSSGIFYVDFPFSFTVDNTCTYVAVAGCDKTWDWCGDQYGNQDNFGGFLHVTKES